MTHTQRVKQVRARARIRKWEFRQRHLARGAWHQFRLALAAARDAYAIDDAQLAALVAAGCSVDDRGQGLEPPRRIVWISNDRALRLERARPLTLRFDDALLSARNLALVAFNSGQEERVGVDSVPGGSPPK